MTSSYRERLPPLFVATWKWWDRTGVSIAALVGIAAVVALRYWASDRLASRGLTVYTFTLARVDSLLIGSVTALLLPPKPGARPGVVTIVVSSCLAAGILFGIFYPECAGWLDRGGYTFIAVVCAALVAAASRASPASRLLSSPALTWFGRRSYGIYLYHVPIFQAVESLRVEHSLANFLWVSSLRFGATVMIAAISYRFIESPFLRVKAKMLRPNEPNETLADIDRGTAAGGVL